MRFASVKNVVVRIQNLVVRACVNADQFFDNNRNELRLDSFDFS